MFFRMSKLLDVKIFVCKNFCAAKFPCELFVLENLMSFFVVKMQCNRVYLSVLLCVIFSLCKNPRVKTHLCKDFGVASYGCPSSSV